MEDQLYIRTGCKALAAIQEQIKDRRRRNAINYKRQIFPRQATD